MCLLIVHEWPCCHVEGVVRDLHGRAHSTSPGRGLYMWGVFVLPHCIARGTAPRLQHVGLRVVCYRSRLPFGHIRGRMLVGRRAAGPGYVNGRSWGRV